MIEHILFSLIAAFGGFTQGLTGVGVILVTLPLMALLLDMKLVIPLVGLLALSINIYLGWSLREHMRWRRTKPLLLAALPGIPVGVYVLKQAPTAALQLVLGVVLAGYALYAMSGGAPRRELPSGWAYLAGFLAGCLGGGIGASGPPIIVYTAMQPWDKDAVKSTMISFFLATTIGISAMHAGTGLITKEVLGYYAVSIPGLAVGTLIGVKSYGRISSAWYKRMMIWLLLVLGVLLLWKGRTVFM